MNQNIFGIIIVLAACASLGSALECYACTELTSGSKCADPFTKNVDTAHCPQGQVCVKQITPEISAGNAVVKSFVSRGCGLREICESPVAGILEFCGHCNTDLCNSSITIVPSFTIIALLVVKCFFL